MEAIPTPLTEAEIKEQETQRLCKIQQVWLKRISAEEQSHKDWRDRTRKVEKIFRNEEEEPLYVPLYWSVVNVQHTGIYSNQPVPDVRPRNEGQDPIMKQVSLCIARGLSYCVDNDQFDVTMHRTIDDYLAMALGVPRMKIDSVIKTTLSKVPEYRRVMGPQGPENIQVGEREEKNEEIGDQTIRWEYIPWRRFGWQPCNHWNNCQWIYIRHRMTNPEIQTRFNREVSASKDEKDRADTKSWRNKTFDIYEVWDRAKKKVLFIAKGEKTPLEINDDPLELKDFFPCPPPLMLNVCSEELIPQSDYEYIAEYDRELNRLQERRMGLIEQIKATGAYDSGLPELAEMIENEDGEYTAIQNLMGRLSAAGGPDNAIYHLPIQEKIIALQQTSEQIGFVKAQVDEILGISDIVRGVTAASETATAQEIKGRWVGIRLTRKREAVQFMIRHMMRMMAQLLTSHITPENLQRMTQMPITEEMMAIMQDDLLMEFAIDIETDSTVAKDEFAEMQTKQEMLNGVAQFAQSVLPMVAQNMMPADVSSAILKSAITPYARYDRGLDEALNNLPQTQQQLQQMSQQMQQLQQQLQQAQQGMQYWQSEAQKLQQQATQAIAAQKMADAGKKQAETQEIVAGLPDKELQPVKTIVEIQNLEAQTQEIESGRVYD